MLSIVFVYVCPTRTSGIIYGDIYIHTLIAWLLRGLLGSGERVHLAPKPLVLAIHVEIDELELTWGRRWEDGSIMQMRSLIR
jgi:hypothetical protein